MQIFAAILLASMLALSATAEAVDTPASVSPVKTVTKQDKREAEKAFMRGAKLYRENDFDAAEVDFLQALKLNPNAKEYLVALSMARDHRVAKLVQKAAAERTQERGAEADALIAKAHEIDPTNPLVMQHERPPAKPVQVERLAGALQIHPVAKKESFHIKSQSRGLMQQVASSYGIRTVFDQDISSKNVRLDVDDVDFETAMHIVCLLTDMMYVPLDEKSIFVAKDTTANHKRLDRLEQETLILPALKTEEINDLASVMKAVFDVKQVTVQGKAGTINLRATPDILQAINSTVAELMDDDSEVMLRVQLFETDMETTRGTGLTPPQQVSMASVAGLAQQIVNDNQDLVNQLIASGTIPANSSTVNIALALIGSGLVQNNIVNGALAIIGGGLTSSLISAGNYPVLHAALLASDSKTLEDIQLRGNDRQIIDFRIGMRYPVTQSTYSSGVNSSLASQISKATGTDVNSVLGNSFTIPQVTYEDLGLVVKTTPRVGRNGDISLHLEMKLQALTGASANGIPVLSSRALSSDITVHAGDTAMISSALTEQEARSIDGTPGLSEIPILKYLTSHTSDKTKSNLVILLTPVLVRRGHMRTVGPYVPVHIPTPDE